MQTDGPGDVITTYNVTAALQGQLSRLYWVIFESLSDSRKHKIQSAILEVFETSTFYCGFYVFIFLHVIDEYVLNIPVCSLMYHIKYILIFRVRIPADTRVVLGQRHPMQAMNGYQWKNQLVAIYRCFGLSLS